MEKEIAKELIKLDVLDRTNLEESEALEFFKKDNDFPYETLGNYQNLVAIIAATSGLLTPPQEVKSTILDRLFKLRQFKQVKSEEVLLLEVDGQVSQVQIFDAEQTQEAVELVEAIAADSAPTIEAKKKLTIDELRSNKSPITIKDPNFSNIHLIIEDRKSKVSKVRENPVPITPNEQTEISTPVLPEEVKSLEEHIEENKKATETDTDTNTKIVPVESNLSLELTKHTIRKKRVFPLFKPSVLRRDRSRTILAASIFVVFSVVLYLLIELTQTSPVEVAESKTLPGTVLTEKNNEPFAQNVNAVVEVEKIEKPVIAPEVVKETQLKNEKPPLPEPPKPIEIPIEEIPESQITTVAENLKERSVDLPVLTPIEEKKLELESPYFVAVEEMPEPIGGIAAIQSKIVYPEIAKRAGIEGRVFVLAYVDETGKVTNAEITKGIGSGCDEAARDAVMNTKFKPGVQRGKPVKVKITIPIVFKR